MKNWYQITAKKNNRAKILIYEQIGEDYWDGGGVSAKQFVKDLDALDVADIDLHINSPGGSVFEGTSIHNALRAHPAEVHVTIDGIAASIASVIAMAGDDVAMPQNAMLMIHDPSGLVVGTADDMRKMAEALEKVKGGMVAAYQLRADLTDEEVAEMMSDETWLTAQDALDYGFADSIIDPVKLQANFQALADFHNVPASLLPPIGRHVRAKTKQPIYEEIQIMDKITLELIQSKHPEIIEAVLKALTLEQITANHSKIVEALQAEGSTQGAEKEGARIQAVKAQLIPGHEALIETLMFDGQTTGEQAAVQVLAAEKKMRDQAILDNKNDAPPVLKQPPADDDTTPPDASLPLADRCKAAWDKDPKLRDEFSDDYEGYLAYEKAIAKGQVRELHKK